MDISTRGEYALQVLSFIALQNKRVVSVAEIAEQEGISIKYLEKILSLLLKSKLVTSQRGAFGGYTLSKQPNEISVAEVLSATDDMPKFGDCSKCEKLSSCHTSKCWISLSKMISDFLSNLSIQDLIDKKL